CPEKRTSFFIDTATTEIYTLSLHDALPIFGPTKLRGALIDSHGDHRLAMARPEEHTSELQSLAYLVWRLLRVKQEEGLRGGRAVSVLTSTTVSLVFAVQS